MTISNTIDTKSLQTTLQNLVAEREAWETGSYAKANEELYALLDKCMIQYEQVKNSPSLRAVVSEMLNERNIAFNASTNTLTKIVRLVFGDCGKRAFTYARVIKVALAEKPENQSLASFIVMAGGIEEIRRRSKDGVSPAVLRAQRIAAATQKLSNASGLFTVQTSEEIAPHSDTENNLSLAILRLNADGTSSIVCGIKNKGLLNAALEQAARQVASAETAEAEIVDQRNKRQATDAKIKAANVTVAA